VEALAVLARLLMDDAQIEELLGVLTMTNAMRELNEMLDDALRRGHADGELEGYRQGLRALVRARFGAVPDTLEQRIATASRATLDDLYARALTVSAVDML